MAAGEKTSTSSFWIGAVVCLLCCEAAAALASCVPNVPSYLLPSQLPTSPLPPVPLDFVVSQCAIRDSQFAAGQARLASKLGNVIVGGLFPMRVLRGEGDLPFERNVTCRVDGEQVQPAMLMTLLSVLHYLDNDVGVIGRAVDGSPLTLGYDLRDSCSSPLCAARETYTLTEHSLVSRCAYDTHFPTVCRMPLFRLLRASSCANASELRTMLERQGTGYRQRLPPASLILGPFHSRIQQAASIILTVYSVPAIGIGAETAHPQEALISASLLRHVTPRPGDMARAVLDVLVTFDWSYVAMVTQDTNYFMSMIRANLVSQVSQTNVCVTIDSHLSGEESNGFAMRGLANMLNKRPRVQVLVLLTGQRVARDLLDTLHRGGVRPLVFIGMETWVRDHYVMTHPAIASLLMVSRRATSGSGRRAGEIVQGILSDGVPNLPPELLPYWERIFRCSACNGSRDDTNSTMVDPAVGGGGGGGPAGIGIRDVRESVTLTSQCGPLPAACAGDQASRPPCTMDEIGGQISGVEVDLLADYILPPVLDALLLTTTVIRRTLADFSHLFNTSNYAIALPTDTSLLHFQDAIRTTSRETRRSPLILSNVQTVELPGGRGTEKRLRTVGAWRRVRSGGGNILVLDNATHIQWGSLSRGGGVGRENAPRSQCSVPCEDGYSPVLLSAIDPCCWNCTRCATHHIRSAAASPETCQECGASTFTNAAQTACEPLELTYAALPTPVAVICTVLVVSAAILFMITFVVYAMYRASPIVRASDFKLTMLFIFCLFVGVLTQGVFILRPDDIIPCSVKPPLTYTWQVACFAVMLIKTRRMAALFSLSLRQLMADSSKLRDHQQVLFVAILTLVGFVMSLIWTLTNPPRSVTEVITAHQTVILYCSTNIAWILILASYLSLLNILTLVLAYKTRKIPDNYNEAGFLFLASFLSNFLSFALLPAYFATSDETIRPLQLCMFSTLTLITLWACVCLPRMYRLMQEPKGGNSRHRSSNGLNRLQSFHAGLQSSDQLSGLRPARLLSPSEGSGDSAHSRSNSPIRADAILTSSEHTAVALEQSAESLLLDSAPLESQQQHKLQSQLSGCRDISHTSSLDDPDEPVAIQESNMMADDDPGPLGQLRNMSVAPTGTQLHLHQQPAVTHDGSDSHVVVTTAEEFSRRLRQDSCPATMTNSVRTKANQKLSTDQTSAVRRRSISAFELGSKESKVARMSAESPGDESLSLWHQLKEWAGFGDTVPPSCNLRGELAGYGEESE
ncbi:metabotropic glutamate receptor-like [Sycon ciliatum]|uniref:metabotropic glutamate receptor-like n=1 Tax=Sycon ciliatum TaxID=27933 RepID=UPI0031F5FCAE